MERRKKRKVCLLLMFVTMLDLYERKLGRKFEIVKRDLASEKKDVGIDHCFGLCKIS